MSDMCLLSSVGETSLQELSWVSFMVDPMENMWTKDRNLYAAIILPCSELIYFHINLSTPLCSSRHHEKNSSCIHYLVSQSQHGLISKVQCWEYRETWEDFPCFKESVVLLLCHWSISNPNLGRKSSKFSWAVEKPFHTEDIPTVSHGSTQHQIYSRESFHSGQQS